VALKTIQLNVTYMKPLSIPGGVLFEIEGASQGQAGN
jgi:hypothetical protein